MRFLCCGYLFNPSVTSCHLPYILLCKTQRRRVIFSCVSGLFFSPAVSHSITGSCVSNIGGDTEDTVVSSERGWRCIKRKFPLMSSWDLNPFLGRYRYLFDKNREHRSSRGGVSLLTKNKLQCFGFFFPRELDLAFGGFYNYFIWLCACNSGDIVRKYRNPA